MPCVLLFLLLFLTKDQFVQQISKKLFWWISPLILWETTLSCPMSDTRLSLKLSPLPSTVLSHFSFPWSPLWLTQPSRNDHPFPSCPISSIIDQLSVNRSTIGLSINLPYQLQLRSPFWLTSLRIIIMSSFLAIIKTMTEMDYI